MEGGKEISYKISYNRKSMQERLPINPGESLVFFHNHTKASDGMVNGKELVQAVSKFTEIAGGEHSFLIPTDHDTTKGAEEAIKASQSHQNVTVVPGIETTATFWKNRIASKMFQKHIGAIFNPEGNVDALKPIPHSKNPGWVLDEIASRGGISVASHPFLGLVGLGSLTFFEIRRLQEQGYKIDGIEVISGNSRKRKEIEEAIDAFDINVPLKIAGADSHFGEEDLFRAINIVRGTTISDLFFALRTGNIIPLEGDKSRVGLVSLGVQCAKAVTVTAARRYLDSSESNEPSDAKPLEQSGVIFNAKNRH